MVKVSMKMASNLLVRVPPFFKELAEIIAGDIDCDLETLKVYSTDGSPYSVFPQAVIHPKNATDIKHILSFAREFTMPITIRGCGKSKNGTALSEGIILDLKRYFSQIRNINMMENTITVDAGVTVEDLLEKLHSWHYDIPALSSGDRDCTIGSVISLKNASSSSFHHGTIREWVEGLTVVVDNGEEHKIADGITPSGRLLGIYQEVFPFLTHVSGTIRAAKPRSHDDGTGYNIWNTSIGPRQLIDQLTGSEGTLAIITSVTFRICPRKQHMITTAIPVATKAQLPTFIEIAKHHAVDRIFLYDEAFMQLSERYHPTLVPFFVDTPFVLLVTHTSTDKEKLHASVRTWRAALPIEDHFLKTFDDEKKLNRIISSEFLFSLYSSYTSDSLIPVTVGDGLIVTIHQLPTFLEEVINYLDSLGKVYTLTGNVGSGHVSAITLFDPQSKSYDDDLFFYAKNLFTILKRYNGGMSAVSGDGLSRTPFLSYIYSDATLSVFKKIKEIWDPLSILNSGKKINVSTNYLKGHISRKFYR